jgi:hypothetical protein
MESRRLFAVAREDRLQKCAPGSCHVDPRLNSPPISDTESDEDWGQSQVREFDRSGVAAVSKPYRHPAG